MTFAQFGPYTELASIGCGSNQQPACTSQQITYNYDTNGNLLLVTRPGNATDDATRTQTITSFTEQYWYYPGTHEMRWVGGPRFISSSYSDGSNYGFNYDANTTTGRLTWISDYGIMNFTPSDGTGAQLQPGTAMNGNTLWRQTEFVYNYNSTGLNVMRDTDGHAAQWKPDSLSRIVYASNFAGAGDWLITKATWDANNDRTASIDARNNETDIGYDANGNVVAIAEPTVTTSSGPLRPTLTFSYDTHNNLIASCDADYNTTNSWYNPANPPPVCPTAAGTNGVATYAYNYVDSNEPFGVLANSYTPMGYEITYSYANGPVSDNYGLPTQVVGATVTQADNTTRTPTTTYTYDAYGDITSVNHGNSTWTMTYDALNRLLTTADPDPGNPTSYTYYNPDGSISKTETPYQHANGWGSTFVYDANGNVLTTEAYRMTKYNSTPAQYPTKKWYDGEDRLIEVQQPHDPTNDALANAWTTRYLYDISQGSGVSINPGNVSYLAYGNLYKTQELLPTTAPATLTTFTAGSGSNPSFADLSGNAFDGLDRPVTRYSFIAQSNTSAETLIQETLTYDQSSYFSGDFAGRLTEDCKSAQPQQCHWYNYDARGAATQVHFSDTLSADRSSTYDSDGHTMSLTSATFGTESYSYNRDGLETTEQEAQGGGVTSPATFTHEYYLDDTFRQLDVASSGLNQTGLMAYSYRPDGKVQTEAINYGAQSNVGSTSVAFTYTLAGRLSGRAETGPGGNSSPTTWTYDSYGRLSQEVFPTCSQCGGQTLNPPLSSLVWDPQGQLMETAYATFNYSTRGDALGATGKNLLANGASLPSIPAAPGYSGPYSVTWDPLAGAMLSTSWNAGDSTGDSMTTGIQVGYDNIGRMLSSSSSTSFSGSIAGNGASWSQSDTVTRAYDDENHTISSSFVDANQPGTAVSGLALYQWGPTGHPVLIGSATNTTTTIPSPSAVQYDTLHWDGDQLIFASNASGKVNDIKIGTEGDITPLDTSFSGLTFFDRGPDGSVMYCHNYTGVTGNGAVDSYSIVTPCVGGTIQSVSGYTFYMPSSFLWQSNPDVTKKGVAGFPSWTYRALGIGQGMLLGMLRTDGVTDGINTIQGVRIYDGNSGQWTSPDAFAGSTDDPRSQKAYLWNGGNPFANSDPSGFVTGYSHDPLTGLLDADPLSGMPTNNGLPTLDDLLSLNPSPSAFRQGPPPSDSCGGVGTICDDKLVIADVQSETAALAKQLAYNHTMISGWTAFLGVGMGFLGGPAAEEGAALERMATVVHYTDDAGAAAIRASGLLRAGSWVTRPNQIPLGASSAEIERLLELLPGRGANSFTFQVPESQLIVPMEGSLTSGGALQFRLASPYALPQ